MKQKLIVAPTIFGLFLVSSNPGLGSGVEPQEHEEKCVPDYTRLTEPLGRSFRVKASQHAGKNENPLRVVSRFEFVSEEPVRSTPAGPIFLRLDLTLEEYDRKEEAGSDWEGLKQRAHPDMGLSYSWDFVQYMGKEIVHLHADCTLSEPAFKDVKKRLMEELQKAGRRALETIDCRCGAGCRLIKIGE